MLPPQLPAFVELQFQVSKAKFFIILNYPNCDCIEGYLSEAGLLEEGELLGMNRNTNSDLFLDLSTTFQFFWNDDLL